MATRSADPTSGQVLCLTGVRLGELLALDKSDITSEGLNVSKSSLCGKAGNTKSKKSRLAPLAPELRRGLEAWAATTDGSLLFPTPNGKMYWRQSEPLVKFVN